jgi:hypothetical protein
MRIGGSIELESMWRILSWHHNKVTSLMRIGGSIELESMWQILSWRHNRVTALISDMLVDFL